MSFAERIGLGPKESFPAEHEERYLDLVAEELCRALASGIVVTLSDWCDMTTYERAVVESYVSRQGDAEREKLEELIDKVVGE